MISGKKIARVILGLGTIVLIAGVSVAQEKAAPTLETYEGTVKIGFGKYMYLPEARGFDIITEGFDAATLTGKEVRLKGALLTDKPSLFRADSIEVKDASGSYTLAYTRSQDVTFGDVLDQEVRFAFAALTITNANRAEDWEGKERAKIYGRIQQGDPTYIILTDDRGREVGKIIVDAMTDYAKFYLNKLRLFDRFWFYVNIKESVERRVRQRTRELFHADVVFAGLF